MQIGFKVSTFHLQNLLYMRKFLFLLLFATFNFAAIAQPINDNCSAATVIPVQSNPCVTASPGTTVNATASTQTAFIPSSADDDVWYKFTTSAVGTAGSVKVVVSIVDVAFPSGSPQSIYLEQRAGTGSCDPYYPNSTMLSSSGGNWLLTGLNPSTEYSIRVYTDDNTSRMTFGFCAYYPPVPANDDCGTASTISVTGNTGFIVQSAGTVGATASTQASGDFSGKDDDVWFQFTTPATAKNVKATLSEISYNASGQPVVELWDACGDASFINWYPYSTTPNFGTLVPNKTYRIRVYTYGSSSRFNSFKLTIDYAVPNDTYFTAESITLSSATSCTTITSGTTLGTTSEMPPACSGASSPPNDVWYTFTSTNPIHEIKLTNVTLVAGSNANMYMQLFRGSNTNSVLCSSTGSMSLDGSSIANVILSGTTYYLRIYNEDASSACTFNICSRVLPAPVNNNCSGAISVPVNTTDVEQFVSATNVGATASSPALSCSGTANYDVWFKFIAPTSGKAFIKIFNSRALINVGSGSPYFALYSGTCGSPTLVSCNSDLTGAFSGLTSGSTYFIRVFDVPGNQYAFDLSIMQLPATQTNITCATATPIDANWIQGTTLGLTSANIVPCGGGSPITNKEVWYSFNATGVKHLIDFKDMVRLSPNQNSLGFKLFSGTCAGLTEVGCKSGVQYSNDLISGLTIGNTYYVQVLENTFNGGPVSYKIRTIKENAADNDEMAGAVTLIQSPDCQNVQGTFKFSTVSSNPVTGTFSGDVWYKFVAASTNPTIALPSTSSVYMVVYQSNGSTIFHDPGFGTTNLQLTGATIGNTYYVRVYNQSTASLGPNADFTICISGVPNTILADQPTVGSTCITIDGPVVSTNSLRWLHLMHQGKIVASVFDQPGNAGMGNIIGKYYINSGAVRADGSGIEYLNRNFEITPTIQPVSPVRVRLYFSKSEFDAMVQANDADGNDVYYLNDLKISKFSSNPCSNVLNLAGELLYNISNWGSLSSSVYYVEVMVPSFSSFFLKNVSGVLPVTCIDFSAERKNNRVNLKWTTATENNADHYEIERSIDGKNFNKIGTIAAKGTGSVYAFTDEAITQKGVYYYRLMAVDKDGSKKFACNTVKVSVEGGKEQIFGNIYPNPVKDEMMVQLQRSYAGSVGLQIISSTGQVMQQTSVNLQSSDVKIGLNTSGLSAGVYVLRLQTVKGIETIRFTKQ